MTSAQHAKWERAGVSWRLARPLAALRDKLRAYGYTVYDIGNTAHMDHKPPEDHTPYSETGWPVATAYGWVTAIDIMPPSKPGLPSLQRLGAQIYADRPQWIKYMNWGPVDNSHAVKDSWKPNHARSASGDTGHIHISCRSDALTSTSADSYDPVARLRGVAISRGCAMFRIGVSGGDGAVFVTNGNGRTLHIGPEVNDVLDKAGIPMLWVPSVADMDALTNFDKPESDGPIQVATDAVVATVLQRLAEALKAVAA